MTFIDYLVLIVYFVAMAGIGIWAMRSNKKQEDYFMGGRKFGKVLQTFAAFGAGTGAQDPIIVGRTTWTSGLTGIWGVLLWLFVTPFYWIFGVWYRRMRHLTIGDWFVERYESKGMGAAYTVFAIVFYILYTSTMFTGISKVAESMMGADAIAAMGGLENVKFVLVPTIAFFIILYGALGGLTAAYWTDLVQGVFIILLSLLLIPFGLYALVEQFGDPSTQSWVDGFSIMHDRLPESYFQIFGGPRAGEFPLHYIVSLTLLALLGIVVQPHFITTGGGSAKTEFNARVGLVFGNFLKRFCTVGWALTGLIVLALLAGNVELAEDPDKVWGLASSSLLGPIGIGLVGLMLACLLAALMSSADTYMIVSSALVVRNVYAPYINADASEKTYVNAGRAAGLIVIIGAAIASLLFWDVFKQFTLALELTIVFAAPFWLGMFWRRTGRAAAWGTMAFSLVFFFVLPSLLPLMPGLNTNSDYTTTTNIITTTVTRSTTQVDVARREAAIKLWENRRKKLVGKIDDRKRTAKEKDALQKQLDAFAPKPLALSIDQPFIDTFTSGGKSIFWRKGVKPAPDSKPQDFKEEIISDTKDGNKHVVVKRKTGPMQGQGEFRLDFLFYHWAGVDLANISGATIQTLRLPPRLIMPFIVLIILSFLTKRNSKEALDRYFVKMKTEVLADPEEDRAELEKSYQNPDRFNHRKLFPNSEFEFNKPRVVDIVGFVISFIVCFLILGLIVLLVNIGS